MNYLLLTAIVLGCSVQNINKKHFNLVAKNGTYTFSAASVFFALIFFVATLKNPTFSAEFLIYSVLFALSYSVATIFSVLSIKEGSLSISSLIISYSLLLPTVYGIIFENEDITAFLIIGLILLIVSLLLINFEKGSANKQITFKWLIYILLAFIGNGFCSITQRMQQINCEGQYKNEFMIVALAISTGVMSVLALIFERENLKHNLKSGVLDYSICGLANGMVNLFVIILSLRMSASVMFPVISAGGIVISMLVAMFWFKEKLSKFQYAGLVLGIGSVVFLNL